MKDLGVFGGRPVRALESGVEVVDVAFPALFPGAVGHGLGDEGPFHGHAHGLDHV